MNMSNKAKSGSLEVQPYQRLVSLPIKSENIFHFPQGLPAFEHVKEFVFLLPPNTQPFIFMQAIAPADLAFVCIDPFLVCPDYKPSLGASDLSFLNLKRPEDALLLTIVTVRHAMTETTTNLQAPLVINIQSCVGKQIICDGQHYPVRYRIWDALDRMAASTARDEGGNLKPECEAVKARDESGPATAG
ncbi:MAG: flagellar assembly protein FliW [Lentisphaerae bacterium]|nr:flagellar assembly protein FliW [Lentisphaerota bacterium]